MDGATLQARINAGYGKGAAKVGLPFSIYRPASDLLNPVSPGNLVGTVPAAFAVTGVGFQFEKPSSYKNPLFNGLFDPTLVQVGDYLNNEAQGTYFVAALQPLAPPLVVQCNRVVSVAAPGPAKTTFGAQTAYSGSTEANQQPVLADWPASILFEARGRQNEVALPMDLPGPFFQILLPETLAADLRSGQVITDDDDRRYVIASSEKSVLGWRLSAQQAVT